MSAMEVEAPNLSRAGLSLRPATLADARLYAELTAVYRPDEPADPGVTAHGWANPTQGYGRERFIIEVGGRPAGFAWHLEADVERDPERNGDLNIFLVPAAMSHERYRAALELVEERSAAVGVRILRTDIWEDATEEAAVLTELGYVRDRMSRVWELDLVENGDRLLLLAGRAEALMREQGIRCGAVADDGDPEIWSRCYEAQMAASEDIPRTGPFIRPTFEQFTGWLSSPDFSARWYFTAKDGDRVIGMSNLRFPPVQGNVWTGFTGVVREYRGRGVARAVKMALLKQAIDQNVPRVRTDNDEANGPMLHINEELGYQRIPGILSFRKQR
jgi:RimJ/RimL family protein N-acetyltransferase